MSASQSPLRTVLLLFCLPLLGALTAGLLGLSFPLGLLPVALTAGLGAWLGLRFRPPAADSAPSADQPTSAVTGRLASKPTDSPSNRTLGTLSDTLSGIPTGSPTHKPSGPNPTESPAHSTPATAPAEADPTLRHDIRNILSPAMLAAEQLGASTDLLVLKAVRTIDESLDRVLLRLKQKPQS